MQIPFLLQTLCVAFITLVTSDETLRTRTYNCPSSSVITSIFSAQGAIMDTLRMECSDSLTSKIPDMGRPLYTNTPYNRFTANAYRLPIGARGWDRLYIGYRFYAPTGKKVVVSFKICALETCYTAFYKGLSICSPNEADEFACKKLESFDFKGTGRVISGFHVTENPTLLYGFMTDLQPIFTTLNRPTPSPASTPTIYKLTNVTYTCPEPSAIYSIFSAQGAMLDTLIMKCNDANSTTFPSIGRPLDDTYNHFTGNTFELPDGASGWDRIEIGYGYYAPTETVVVTSYTICAQDTCFTAFWYDLTICSPDATVEYACKRIECFDFRGTNQVITGFSAIQNDAAKVGYITELRPITNRLPTSMPTGEPTSVPSSKPTGVPSSKPTGEPTGVPSSNKPIAKP